MDQQIDWLMKAPMLERTNFYSTAYYVKERSSELDSPFFLAPTLLVVLSNQSYVSSLGLKDWERTSTLRQGEGLACLLNEKGEKQQLECSKPTTQ